MTERKDTLLGEWDIGEGGETRSGEGGGAENWADTMSMKAECSVLGMMVSTQISNNWRSLALLWTLAKG